ncbi:MAG: hypothetical protein P4L31_02435 [Candidatus Babeliales bacterium]|nr:hypothetical protein [Candidatus Babeliales bacterium]
MKKKLLLILATVVISSVSIYAAAGKAQDELASQQEVARLLLNDLILAMEEFYKSVDFPTETVGGAMIRDPRSTPRNQVGIVPQSNQTTQDTVTSKKLRHAIQACKNMPLCQAQYADVYIIAERQLSERTKKIVLR